MNMRSMHDGMRQNNDGQRYNNDGMRYNNDGMRNSQPQRSANQSKSKKKNFFHYFCAKDLANTNKKCLSSPMLHT